MRGLDAPAPGAGLLRDPPVQVGVEAGAARPRSLASSSGGVRPRRTARRRRPGRQSSIGSARTVSSERSVASSVAAAPAGRREQPGRHVQPEEGQRLRARRRQLGAEDRRVGQRVAVDLARRHVGDAPGGRLPWRPELLVALVVVEGARIRVGGSAARSGGRGPRGSMMTLSRAASGAVSAGGVAEEPAERRPGAALTRRGARGRRSGAAGAVASRSSRASGSDAGHLGPGPRLGAGRAGHPPSAPVSAPIPPTGTSQSPVPPPTRGRGSSGSGAGPVVGGGERADQRVGQHDAARGRRRTATSASRPAARRRGPARQRRRPRAARACRGAAAR